MRWHELMETTFRSLFNQYGGKIMPFDQLPEGAQKALHTYLGEYDDEETYARDSYGYVAIPAQVLASFCWNAPDNDMRDSFASWDEYAQWYWSHEDDSNYSDHLNGMWPVILNDNEGILDGWHRLHWYLRNRVSEIPAILYV